MRMFFCFAALLLLCSCGISEGMAARSNLEKVKIGMTKAEVTEVMGEPVKDELYATDNLWFYYTKPRWFDGLVTRDECTPFVFDAESGKLLGYGYEFYHLNYGIPEWPLKKQ